MPFADNSLYKLPEGVTDEAAVMLSDILPTGFEIGVRYGRVKPGDVVAVVGAGPVGLGAIMTAGLYGPSRVIAIDLDENRLDQAKKFGATDAVNSGDAGWKEQVAGDDRRLRRRRRDRGGRDPGDLRHVHRDGPARRDVANVGVHGKPVELRCRTCGSRTSRSPWAWSAPRRRRCCSSWSPRGSWPPEKFVSHHFALDKIIDAYDTFGRAAETKALKVVIAA